MSRKPRKVVSGSSLILAALLSACAPETEVGATSPVTGVSSAAATGAPVADPVPAVQNDLQVTPYLTTPCDLVPREFMSKRGYTGEGRSHTADTSDASAYAGPACGWTSPVSGTMLLAAIQSGNKDRGIGGLGWFYAENQRGRYEYWEPATVSGYPAVYFDARDRRGEGDCSLTVGIADDMTFTVFAEFYRDEPDRACTEAKEVAAHIVSTLKGEN